MIVSSDEKFIFNVGGTVSIFDISGQTFKEFARFNTLKNPSHIAVSTDHELIAYTNTSGHIAVHEITSKALVNKSKGISKEGYNLYFINENKQILSMDWGGNIFIFDINTSATTILGTINTNSSNLIYISKNTYLVVGYNNENKTEFHELTLTDESITKHLICTATTNYMLETVNWAKNEANIIFVANDENIYKLMQYNIFTHEIVQLDISGLPKFGLNVHDDYGYFTCISLSNNGKYLLIGLINAILVIDFQTKKFLGMLKVNYLSSLNFISSDDKVVIGTWSQIHIVPLKNMIDFSENDTTCNKVR